MDKQVAKRQNRLYHVELTKHTTAQWDLIVASAEEANIIFHNLVGEDAKKMNGEVKNHL